MRRCERSGSPSSFLRARKFGCDKPFHDLLAISIALSIIFLTSTPHPRRSRVLGHDDIDELEHDEHGVGEQHELDGGGEGGCVRDLREGWTRYIQLRPAEGRWGGRWTCVVVAVAVVVVVVGGAILRRLRDVRASAPRLPPRPGRLLTTSR